MRAKPIRLLCVAVVLSAVVLCGCTNPGADGRRDPAAGATASSSPEAETPRQEPDEALEFVGRGSSLVQDLWQPVGSMAPLRTALPRVLRIEDAAGAPSLHEAPIESAVLAAGTDPQSFGVGEVGLMSPDGEWRIVDRDRLGMRKSDIVEQQFELSPNGRQLALGDQYGVVVVDLASGAAVRVEVPFRDPVLHWWTPDGVGVVVTARGGLRGGAEAVVVRPRDRAVEPVGYDPWSSSVDRDGRVVEFARNSGWAGSDRFAPGDVFTTVRTWPERGEASEVARLENAVPSDAEVGSHLSTLVGVVQGAYPQGRKLARGVLAIDPTTGQSRGLLELAPDRIVWASVIGVLDHRWLLLHVPYGPGGGLCAWDPVAAELRGVMTTDEQATTVSLATDLMRRSPR